MQHITQNQFQGRQKILIYIWDDKSRNLDITVIDIFAVDENSHNFCDGGGLT